MPNDPPSKDNHVSKSRVLFLTEAHPITPDGFGGGSAVVYSRLELLAHFGAETHLVLLFTPGNRDDFQRFLSTQPDTWSEVRGWLATYHELDLSPVLAGTKAPVRNAIKLLREPLQALFPVINEENLAQLRTIVVQIKPDIIWAEHYLAAWLAIHASPEARIIYGHYDWEWKLIPLRRKNDHGSSLNIKAFARQSLRIRQRKRLDEALVRQVAAVAAVSSSEADDVSKLGSRNVVYLPPGYPPIDLPPKKEIVDRPRIVHLGQMRTTATRVGLEDFLERCWPDLECSMDQTPELWVIGRLDGASSQTLATLERIGAVCPGFVGDLSTVLRPYDIHIVPWSHNTGVRTRIPLALNYAQALVAMRATAACLDELRDGENCLLVNDFGEMARAIRQLLDEDAFRRRIADEGRKTFLASFTREGLQPRFNQFLQQLLVMESR